MGVPGLFAYLRRRYPVICSAPAPPDRRKRRGGAAGGAAAAGGGAAAAAAAAADDTIDPTGLSARASGCPLIPGADNLYIDMNHVIHSVRGRMRARACMAGGGAARIGGAARPAPACRRKTRPAASTAHTGRTQNTPLYKKTRPRPQLHTTNSARTRRSRASASTSRRPKYSRASAPTSTCCWTRSRRGAWCAREGGREWERA